MQNREEIITMIIKEEWRLFDLVNKRGGRACCQDDWDTFFIMRKSQYHTWPEELLLSYLQDLREAAGIGHNLISEKYARMMESTAPEEFETFCKRLPYRSAMRLKRQEQVIAQEVAWNEEMSRKYPNFARRGRPVHTSEDTAWVTSAETYLRGEMSTWSDRTFTIYESWIQALSRSDCNLAMMTAENMVKLYGYESIEQLEKRYLLKLKDCVK